MLREFQPATQIASAHVVERHGVETSKTTARLPSLGGLRCTSRRRRECLALCPRGHWLALLRCGIGSNLTGGGIRRGGNWPSNGSLGWVSIWRTLGSSAILGSRHSGGGSDIAGTSGLSRARRAWWTWRPRPRAPLSCPPPLHD